MAITQSPTKFPPALPEALSAAKLLSSLEKQANPLAPGPGGTQIKSVVGGIMDGLQSHMATQAPAPQSDMGQGIGNVIDQLKNAAPILQRQAQDAQVDQIAKRAAEMVQGQGSDEPAFAEGGILGFAQGDPVPLPDLSELEAAAKQARDKYYSYGSVQKQRDPEGFQAAKQNFEDLSNQLSTTRQAQIAQIQKDYPTREAQVAALKSQGAPAPSPAP